MSAALHVAGLTKVYGNGKKALAGLELEVPTGSFFALLGPNGAGKSTLINILADTVREGGGEARLFGRDLFAERLWSKRQMGVVPQEVAFDPFFSARELLHTACGYHGLRPDRAWIDELLERLGLAEHADKNTRQLSGGMRRRLLVAQALVHRPPLVILDEPTAGVDVELRRRLWQFMREINTHGTTILLTTHYLEEAEELCDRVAIIDRGRAIAAAPMRELLGELGNTQIRLSYAQPPGSALLADPLLAPFNPRLGEGGQLMLDYARQTGGFDGAYQAARTLFGAPQSLEMVSERLEDVFVRLTEKCEGQG